MREGAGAKFHDNLCFKKIKIAPEGVMLSVGGEGEENVLEVDNNVTDGNEVVDGMINASRVINTVNSKDI